MNMKNLSLVADWHQGFMQRANLLLHTLCSLEMKLDELLLALIKHLGLGLPFLLQFLSKNQNSTPQTNPVKFLGKSA
jgi:hypothetical protein